MSQSTQIDVNYLSYACDSNNTCCWSLCAGSQYIVQVPAPTDNSTAFSPANASDFASILKLADNANINLSNVVAVQGSECSLDANNNVIATVQGTLGVDTPNVGNQIVSVKGGSNVTLNTILKGSGNRMNADVLVDNWSDQDYDGSVVDLTKCTHNTGREVKVVYRFFASTINGKCNKLYFYSLCLTLYWWAKYFIRLILGIKKGQKGPSWF